MRLDTLATSAVLAGLEQGVLLLEAAELAEVLVLELLLVDDLASEHKRGSTSGLSKSSKATALLLSCPGRLLHAVCPDEHL